ncbi:hypothetical protein TNCV_3213901 [Trichonephila clavipes]|nr:hypothetical protein TNCV_3213901 [Trichonephila clavipes]
MIIDFWTKGGRQNGSIQNQRRSKCGAPPVIDNRGERWLRRCVWVNRRATVEQLTAQMSQTLDERSYVYVSEAEAWFTHLC